MGNVLPDSVSHLVTKYCTLYCPYESWRFSVFVGVFLKPEFQPLLCLTIIRISQSLKSY
jgi:hypothetical protein